MKNPSNWLDRDIVAKHLVDIGFEHAKNRLGVTLDNSNLADQSGRSYRQHSWPREYVESSVEAFYFDPLSMLVFRDSQDRWHMVIVNANKELRWSGLVTMRDVVKEMVRQPA